MKHNLKNKPSEPDTFNLGEIEALRSYNYRAEKWFEGFEKELPKMLEKNAWTTSMVRNIDVKRKTLWIEIETVKKEILGDS